MAGVTDWDSREIPRPPPLQCVHKLRHPLASLLAPFFFLVNGFQAKKKENSSFGKKYIYARRNDIVPQTRKNWSERGVEQERERARKLVNALLLRPPPRAVSIASEGAPRRLPSMCYQSKKYCPVLVVQQGGGHYISRLGGAFQRDQNRTIPFGLLVRTAP